MRKRMVSAGVRLSLRLAAIALALGVCLPASAAAASWYGAPAGEGNGDCSSAAAACPLLFALAKAAPGDTVYAVSTLGGYDPANSLTVPSGVTLAGLGAPATIRFQAGSLDVQAGAGAQNLDLVALTGANPPLVLAGAAGDPASGDRVLATQLSSAGGQACSLSDATLTNSVCAVATSTGDFAAATSDTVTLRGDDVWGGAVAALHAIGGSGRTVISLVNDIVRGAPGAADLQPDAEGASATIVATHSNFAAISDAGATAFDAVQQDASDQSAPPRLTDPVQNDFSEQPGSPTLGAGVVDPADGAADLDGAPRTLATSYRFAYGTTPELGTTGPVASLVTTDIGALQAGIAPEAAVVSATAVRSGAATLNAVLSPDGGSPQPVSATIGGLAAGRTYFFELAVSGAGGTATSPLLSFATAPLPPPPECQASATRVAGSRRGALPAWHLRLSCPAAAWVTVRAQLIEPPARGARPRTVPLPAPTAPGVIRGGLPVTRSLRLSAGVRRMLVRASPDRVILTVTFRSLFGVEPATLVLRG